MLKKFRSQLGKVFDDDLGTRQWYNIADWIIVLMILLSSVEIFLATFNWPPKITRMLDIINDITLWFFVVEVTLRIWAAPEQSPKYKGFAGRVRYCCTFYGLIDFVSTYPFLIQYFIPLPVAGLRVLRVARIIRIFRITRYAKAFNLLSDSIREKRRELIVSMQFLIIVTFILSLILFYYEHEAQPDVYDNGFVSVVWAFAQYIGDPGEFADTPPLTGIGKVIACIVGVLGIAIVAVPAGILGAGFTETIERAARKNEIEENVSKLLHCFQRKLDRPTGFQVCPPFQTIPNIQARQRLGDNEVVEAANASPNFRLINLASTIPFSQNPSDRLAIEYFTCNRPYGLCVDRNSPFTVIATSSCVDACSGFFAYYLAMIGGFNYVSREVGRAAPYQSFYSFKDRPTEPGFEEFMADIERLTSRPGAWTLTALAASGANEPEYPTQIHFGTGAPKGSEVIGDLINDKAAFQKFFETISTELERHEDIKCDLGRYHNTSMPGLFLRQLKRDGGGAKNDFVMRVAWSVMLWSPRRLEVARKIAQAINRYILHLPDNPEVKDLTVKDFGY